MLALAAILSIVATASHGLGFGRVGNTTQLGQTLNFAATLHLDADEVLPRECVSAEVFSGDSKLSAGKLHVTLEDGAGAGERSVRITSTTLIDEPVVTVNVTVGCSAKVSRTFVAFIDPPLIDPPRLSASDAALLAPQRRDSQVAPLLAVVQATNAAASAGARGPPRSSARAGPRTSGRAVVVAAAPARAPGAAAPARKAKSVAAARSAPAARVAAGGPRLKLEAAPAIVAVPASAAASSALLAEAAAPAASSVQAGLLERDRQRIQLLEESITRLRSDSQATQQTLAALQAQLRRAESARAETPPLLHALAWAVALLALAVLALGWRLARARRTPIWWAAPAPPPAATEETEGQAQAAVAAAPPMPAASTRAAYAYESGPDTMPVGDTAETPPPSAHEASIWPASQPGPIGRSHELSVEELIDLEQQADFFIVLGQDEAAIDLLMSHLRGSGGISPLPYLKLLEIYRRRADTDAYERIRERFNRRFSAYAPGWNADLQRGLLLEDYPGMVARLQSLWDSHSPAGIMGLLDGALFRRDGTEETFDLPAYRELLFLYSIARDLAEHRDGLAAGDAAPNVDLLLPLDQGTAAATGTARADRHAFEPVDRATAPLDLNVSMPVGIAPRADSELSSLDIDIDVESPSRFGGLVNIGSHRRGAG